MALLARSALGVLTGLAILLVAGANFRPLSIPVPHGVLLLTFGVCLAAFVSVDDRIRAPDIRRSSRLVYLWLYLLLGVTELAAWWAHLPLAAAASELGDFLVTGFVVLVLIRLSAVAGKLRCRSSLA